MNFEIICRVCLKEGSMKSIFTTKKLDDDRKVTCSDMLMACATVTVSQEDRLPKQICLSCFKKLWSAYKFRQLCEKSFSCLLDYGAKLLIADEIKVEKTEDVQVDYPDTKLEIGLKREHLYRQENRNCVKEEDLSNEEKGFNVNNNFDDKRENSPFDEDFVSSPKSNSDTEYIERKKHKKKIKTGNKKSSKKKEMVPEAEPKHKRGTGFPCSFCPKIFKKTSRLIAHQDFHMGIKRYFCEICQKSYRSENDHKGMHKRGFKFKCETCSKFFNTKSKLAIHTETHNENREKILCGLDGCTKVFMTTGGLERHRSFHDGLKTVICHLCSKGFIDKYLLQTHLRSHNNERRYPCSYCDKRFIQSSSRIAHERRHTNTKNYHCTQCEKSFVCSSVLKRHLLCHNKSNQEVCRFCGKRFSRLDNRKRHEAVMHGVSEHTDQNAL